MEGQPSAATSYSTLLKYNISLVTVTQSGVACIQAGNERLETGCLVRHLHGLKAMFAPYR